MEFVSLMERPELKNQAAIWFSDKWKVPKEAYLACMDEFLTGQKPLGW